ncbi:MAG TPA: hypothetical protein ENJ73_02975, partial [Desulfobacterales bacterium]|nr:hypothetical protein [Desulfobacterales bacterium]
MEYRAASATEQRAETIMATDTARISCTTTESPPAFACFFRGKIPGLPEKRQVFLFRFFPLQTEREPVGFWRPTCVGRLWRKSSRWPRRSAAFRSRPSGGKPWDVRGWSTQPVLQRATKGGGVRIRIWQPKTRKERSIMDWKVLSSPPRAGEYDTEAFFVQRDQQGNPALPGGPEGLRVQQAVDLGDFAGKEDEKLVLYDTVVGKRRRVVVIGLGDPPYDGETIRVAAGHLAGLTRKTRKLLIHLPEVGVAEAETAEAMVVGFLLGRYRFDRYRKEREEEPLELVALLGGKRQRAACTRGALDARCVAMARDMANEPANRWTP